MEESRSKLRIGLDRGGTGQFLRVELSPEFIRKPLKYVEIAGIAPKGSILTIVSNVGW